MKTAELRKIIEDVCDYLDSKVKSGMELGEALEISNQLNALGRALNYIDSSEYASEAQANNEAIIAKMEEIDKAKDELINLCEAPQYNEIIRAKEFKKRAIAVLEQELQTLKNK
jgi:hypothetical protein